MKVEIEISDEEAVELRRARDMRSRPDCYVTTTGAEVIVLGRIVAALPRPIQVGDKVVYRGIASAAVGQVIAVHGEHVWFVDGDKPPYTTLASRLDVYDGYGLAAAVAVGDATP